MRIVILCVSILCGHILWAGRASFYVCVLDADTGLPIKGAKIEGAFLNYSRGWNESAKDNNVDAWTDSNGYAKLSGNTEAGVGGYRILRTPGYYNAEWTEIEFREQSLLRLGAWIPSGIVSTTRLDRVVNPIPLWVKGVNGEYRARSQAYYELSIKKRDFSVTNGVPVVKDEKLSYDLVKGAWLPPHGDGETCDIQFVFNENVLGWKEDKGYDGTFVMKLYRTTTAISMPGQGNGIVETPSRENAGIKLRIAPEAGYRNNLTRWHGWLGDGDGIQTDSKKGRCYAFRIRTEYDENGKIKSAYYGKIYDDFDVSSLEGVRFLYYLNPTSNDRNLEWDMKNNLCPNSKDNGEPQP